jgi:hypothetical protein
MTKKCTVTWMVNEKYIRMYEGQFREYFKSLHRLQDCTNYILTHLETNQLLVQIAASENCHHVRILPIVRPEGKFDFYRHTGYITLLKTTSHETYIVTDSRDVIFQTDVPIMTGLHLISEGFKYHQSGWNMNDAQSMPIGLDNFEVINAGTQVGSKDALIALYESLLKKHEEIQGGSDQALLNWMVHTNQIQGTIHRPQDSCLCLTGEGVRLGIVSPIRVNGIPYRQLNEPYNFIHQWDRF